MSNATQFLGGGVKSVQRGGTSVPAGTTNVTISAVDPAKSVVIVSCVAKGGEGTGTARLSIPNSTTLAVTGETAVNGLFVTWQVVEYY